MIELRGIGPGSCTRLCSCEFQLHACERLQVVVGLRLGGSRSGSTRQICSTLRGVDLQTARGHVEPRMIDDSQSCDALMSWRA